MSMSKNKRRCNCSWIMPEHVADAEFARFICSQAERTGTARMCCKRRRQCNGVAYDVFAEQEFAVFICSLPNYVPPIIFPEQALAQNIAACADDRAD